MSYTFAEINDILERAEVMEARVADLETENAALKVRLEAKEEFATVHRQIDDRRSHGIWARDVTVIEGEWERQA